MAMNFCTHLMFDGTAEEAMKFYVGLFPGSEIRHAVYYGEGENQGKVQLAAFTLSGAEFLCIDTPIKHDFGFTPAMSIFVDCETFEEIDQVYAALVEGGQALMPLDNYGFSQRFGWVQDRFGVSWQINLPS